MTDDQQMDVSLRAWLQGTTVTPPDADASVGEVMARLPEPDAHTSGRRVPMPTRGYSAFSALKFAAAGAIVALFGGFLLAGILTMPQDGEVPPAAVNDSPTPEFTSAPSEVLKQTVRTDILPGVELTVEEVTPGMYRVVNDGERDLTSVDALDVVAGYDGGIWLLHEDRFHRLASDGSHVWPRGVSPEAHVLEVAPDGTMWVIAGAQSPMYPERRWGGSLHSSDGEEWTVGPCPKDRSCRAFTVAPDGTAWTSWREGPRGYRVFHLGSTGWQPLEGYARLSYHGGNIYYERLLFTDAGDVYGVDYYMGDLARHEDGDWQPVSMGNLIDVGRDGTAWLAAGPDNDASSRYDNLARFADGEWTGWTSADLPDIRLGLDYEFRVAPDGSLWFGLWRSLDGEPPEGDWFHAVKDGHLVCDGLARFDGQALDRFLPGLCTTMDIATDGSVWVLAGRDKDWIHQLEGDTSSVWILADDEAGRDLYVITPEAVPTTEAIDTTAPTTTTSDILPGVTLTVEEVEPGVFRVVHDGVRDVEQVTTTAVSDDGSVWIDSARSIVQLGRAGEHPGLVDGEGFLDFAEDGTLWAASGDAPGDLRSFDGDTWTPQSMRPDGVTSVPDPWLPADYVTDFAVHPDGTIWQVAAETGHIAYTRVQHLGTDAWTTYAIGDGLPDLGCGVDCGEEWDIEITPDGTVWLGVTDGGLLRFDGTDWQLVRPLGGDEDHGASGLVADREGALWAEFETGDLARFDGGAWEILSSVPVDDPYRRRIRAVDPDGNLWAGWDYAWDDDGVIRSCDGVRRFDGSTWTTFLPGMWIADIDIAGDGTVWVTLPSDPSLDWIPGHGYGGDLYVITPEAVPTRE